MQYLNLPKVAALALVCAGSSMEVEGASTTTSEKKPNMVSKLFYVGFDYNVELYLGDGKSEEGKGLFTIDSGSAQFIVNGDQCTSEACTGTSADPLKQFVTPPDSEIVSARQSISYGDGSGYLFNVYKAPVTIPSGQVVADVPVAYNFEATPNPSTNKTDNFNSDGQGIIGLSVPCQASPTGTNTLTEQLVADNMASVSSFTACLNANNGESALAWGNDLPTGMAAADVDFGCAFYSLTYDKFFLESQDGSVNQTLSAAPLQNATNGFTQCGPTPALCALAPIIDTGTTTWQLSEPDYIGLMENFALFYTALDNLNDAPVYQESIDILNKLHNRTIKNPQSLTEEQLSVLGTTFDNQPMTIKVIFQGEGEPSLEPTLTTELMKQVTLTDGIGSILGQSIINGHILHFDKTNKKLGIEKIGESGCDKPYFKNDDDGGAASCLYGGASLALFSAIVAVVL